jgi:hypothetical protein
VSHGLIGAVAAAALALAVTLSPDSPIRLSPDPADSRPPATSGTAASHPTMSQPAASQPAASESVAEPEAGRILLVAASATAQAPAQGAYWRTRVVTGQLILSPDRRYVIERRSTRETWLAGEADGDAGRDRGDNGRDRWTGRYLGARPATPQDEAAWRAAGAPTGWRYPADVTGLGRVTPHAQVQSAPGPPSSGPHRVGWRDADGILTKQLTGWKALQSLPADPTRLRAYLVAGIAREKGAYVGREMEAELRKTCLEIISALPVTPELRASAYRILASIPGMRAEGTVTDPLGRTGQGLGYQVIKDGVPSDERLVIDLDSGLPLAVETRTAGELADGRDVRIGSFTAFEAIGWTDDEPTH